MTVQSMTGFARHEGTGSELSWVWELKSVNGKNLDIRLRLPQGYDELDDLVRKEISKRFKRGNLQVGLQISLNQANVKPVVDVELAHELWSAAKSIQERVGGDLPSASQLMAMRGVLELEDTPVDENARKERNALLIESLASAIDALATSRIEEGGAISKVLSGQIEAIEGLRAKIDASDARSAEKIGANLQAQVAKLIEANDELDKQRLHQEAVILAAKADLQEELDRLEVHLKAASDLLSGEGPVGRKLDFLAQEFNRECNTICSKSNSAEVTSYGLDMKLLIDQFREQVQNME